MPSVSMTVNGKAVTADVDSRTLLVQFLREHLRLTGTHVGCDTSQCGACLIHLNGIAVKSCTALALQCEGANVLTIEGHIDFGVYENLRPLYTEYNVGNYARTFQLSSKIEQDAISACAP